MSVVSQRLLIPVFYSFRKKTNCLDYNSVILTTKISFYTVEEKMALLYIFKFDMNQNHLSHLAFFLSNFKNTTLVT